MLVDLLLVRVVLIREIVHRARRDLGRRRNVPQRLADVRHVHRVQAQIFAPQELHLLVQVLVYGAADDTWREARVIAGAVDEHRTEDDELQTGNRLQLLLGLQLVLGDVGPRSKLVAFFRGFLNKIKSHQEKKEERPS